MLILKGYQSVMQFTYKNMEQESQKPSAAETGKENARQQ